MKEEIANEALRYKHTVAFRFCGKFLFGIIEKIDEDTKMATVVSSIYPNPKHDEDAKLVIPIESLIGCCDTASLMESLDYKDRFVAEYIQLSIRMGTLNNFLERDADAYKVPYEVHELLCRQHLAMETYLEVLKKRAKIENIEI